MADVDFERLRRERNESVEKMLEDICREHGWERSEVRSTFNPDACYCACPDGPCEHDFQGWRPFYDGRGGEQVCSRCGMGAMTHSMRVAP